MVIPFHLPWIWTANYAAQTASILSENNIVVCVLWDESKTLIDIIKHKILPIRFEKDSLIKIYALDYLPFRRLLLIRRINTYINVQLVKIVIYFLSLFHTIDKRIIWIFHPIFSQLPQKFSKQYFVVFDCVDYIETGRSEAWSDFCKLIETADLVTANSHVLLKIIQKFRHDVILVPQGFDLELYSRMYQKRIDRRLVQRPTIGYVGGLNKRLDYKLLRYLVTYNNVYDFVFVGPQQFNKNTKEKNEFNNLLKYPNVRYIDNVCREDVPNIISQFSVGLIPYIISSKYNLYCFPTKLFEYFYVGIPVVSTPVVELLRFKDSIKIAGTHAAFSKAIKEAVDSKMDSRILSKLRACAAVNSWQNKIERISSGIDDISRYVS